ncbi:YceI family protein [Flavobacterium haoranii]|uniref:YceI-like domain-containing protein n=1 Tax=Flavobacterium haoranii TaxID=683124 RepID=A0A1M6FDP9_9FLAO|nr:YceI family protein [Flavobacterium haoranii]SHI95766.1 YceI-like domain-containing protein [Flavobacterium haoranii]
MKSEIIKLGKNVLVAFLLVSGVLVAQESKVNVKESKLTVLGTSNLHDWHANAEVMSGKGTFVSEGNTLKEVKSLNFVLTSEGLKSGKSGMDKNTYKALKTETYKNIEFKLLSVAKITKKSEGVFAVETQGNLTICGVTKKVNQTFTVKVTGGKYLLSGKQTIDMTTYGIEPPTALMGTIKTGKDVTADFSVTYN